MTETGKHRNYTFYRVPVYCECGERRDLKLSDARRRFTAFCDSCSRFLRNLSRSEANLALIQRRGDVRLPSGAVARFSRAYYGARAGTNKANRRWAFVPVECVCGAELKVRITAASQLDFTGLCNKCGPAYPNYLKLKQNPRVWIDRIYYKSTIFRGELGWEMASYKSISPYSVGTVLVHRLVMAQHMGRSLLSGEHVHHINGDKLDNRIGNLMLVDARVHNAITKMETEYEKKIEALEDRIRLLEAELSNAKSSLLK